MANVRQNWSKNNNVTGCSDYNLTRRKFLQLSAAGAGMAYLPITAFASSSNAKDPRLLVVVLRGALDGLAIVPPVGDPDYHSLREGFQLSDDNVLKLDGFFALNANMPNLGQLYSQGDAAIVHASATSYRSRSHFDGQEILETGLPHAGGSSGWLNRAVQDLSSNSKAKFNGALSLGYTAPLILRGKAPVLSWSPQFYPLPDDDTLERILDLYESNDPSLAKLLKAGIEGDAMETGENAKLLNPKRHFLKEIAQTTAKFAEPEGPRIAALSSSGWDTHAAQNPVKGRLANRLQTLDEGIGNLASDLRSVWNDTVVILITEFGRTAAINGARGTDHGTATTAILIGGAVKGGRIIADWPGMHQSQLLDGRDLLPTIHTNSVLKGVLRDHLGLDRKKLDTFVFPDSTDIKPLDNLIS